MKFELYNFVCVFFPLKGIHIQSAGPINEIRLNIQKSAGNLSNDKEIIGLGMSLSKVLFLKNWVVRAFILYLKIFLQI